MIRVCVLKPFLIVCLIIIFNSAASAEPGSAWIPGSVSPLGPLQGGSFTITFTMDEDKFADTITFGSDGTFSIDSLSEIENSTGSYVDLLGILFFANFSGYFLDSPFSYTFYGLYLSPAIAGFNVIELSGTVYTGQFSGTETDTGSESGK